MKKALYFFILIIFTLPVTAESVELYAFTDLMAVTSLLPQKIYGSLGFGASINEDIAVEIPIKILVDQTGGDEILIDTSINLLIYPWERGPYFSISLIQFISFIGAYVPSDRFHYINEMNLGYTWNFFKSFSLSPQISFRDPNFTYSDSYEYIHGFIPSFSKVNFSLNFQITISSILIK